MKQDRDEEIWLRGNVRPVVALAALTAGCGALGGTGLALVGAGARGWAILGVAVTVAAGAACGLGYAAALPRLARRGDRVRVRLTPLRAEEVPLDVVECVFPGSQPVGGAAGDGPAPQRVGTLIVRVAERATEWRERPAFAAWGSWRDGSIAFDGRWCEPLSLEKVRAVAARLSEAKRDRPPAGAPS